MKKSILVTGGAGFIGHHLVDKLVSLHYRVTVVDDLSASNKLSFPKSVKFIKSKVQDPQLIKKIKLIKPEVIFHLAAENSVSSPINKTLASNVIGTYNLLNIAKKLSIEHFIFTSSAAVYGDSNDFPITENHSTQPISAYGLSKLTSELHLSLFQDYFKTTIFRFANVYGPGQSSSSEGGVVAIFINQLLNNQKPFIYGDGQQTRDFIYVADVVEALILSLNQPQNMTINIGSNIDISIIALLKTIAQLLDKPVDFIKKPKRLMDIEKSLFSYALAKEMLGWQPTTLLRSGLLKTIDYFLTS